MFNIQQFNLLFGLFKLTLIPQIAEFSRCSGWVGLKKTILQKKKICFQNTFLAILVRKKLGGAGSHLYWYMICVKHNFYDNSRKYFSKTLGLDPSP